MSAAVRRALVSVSDKSGLVEFVSGLIELGFEIVSTGGTRRTLEEQNLAVMDITEVTGFPEIMGGRVKTLHPLVHGGILGRPDLESDAEAIAEHGIVPFELVICNLYPFEETIAKDGVTISEAIEQIDIGGPSMVRSASKNHAYIGVVTKTEQYAGVLEALQKGSLTHEHRQQLAGAAFEMTGNYDRAIADYFGNKVNNTEDSTFPESMSLSYDKEYELRYGENPHQAAAFFVEKNAPSFSLAKAEKLNGKELSYNNLLDLDSAMALVREFEEPAIAVLKHNNPCGCAIDPQLSKAFEKAYAGDPISAFGSIIGSNRPVDLATAEMMCEPNRFIEAIIAPSFDNDAFELLTTKPKWRKNVRLLTCPGVNKIPETDWQLRKISGGMLVQESDIAAEDFDSWKVVTERQPTDEEMRDLKFSWLVCKHVRSNAIVYAGQGSVYGVGAGQMSRLDSAYMAAYKSGERSQGGVVASDAFFPFRDGIDQAHSAGIVAAVQPGGSVRDEEVIDACNEHGMAMVFTGRRHFKH